MNQNQLNWRSLTSINFPYGVSTHSLVHFKGTYHWSSPCFHTLVVEDISQLSLIYYLHTYQVKRIRTCTTGLNTDCYIHSMLSAKEMEADSARSVI